MKTLKLLNRKYFSIIIVFFIIVINSYAEDEPVDIWNIDKKKIENSKIENSESIKNQDNQIEESNIYNMQSLKDFELVEVDTTLGSKKIKIVGLYDPEDYGLKIDMWSNSNGDQLKQLFQNLSKLKLSGDASELMNIVLLTNAYYPKNNISEKEFSNIKSDWLIKNKNLEIIEKFLIKNEIIDAYPRLSKYLIDQYLSEFNVNKACEVFKKNSLPLNDEYLSKFNIYCLVNEGKNEEAQLILDLKKEMGFKDDYFEKKLNYLIGYTKEVDTSVSEKSILDFHLAHRSNPEFLFEPKENTNKLIWKYLAASNLLYDIDEIEITELDKISLIEKATNDKNYSEKDLFELYKRFQFNINQYLNVLEVYKTMTGVEAKALVYQSILLESKEGKKLELIKVLKDLFIKENLTNAFDERLKEFLKELDVEEIPSNFTKFYYRYLKIDDEIKTKINFNNEVLHQSKLINYFNGDYAKSKIEKDMNSFLKKIKKNKKYIMTKKDIIFIESIKSDDIEISKKYDDLYELIASEMPTDIQVMINNNEVGAVILRIIEVIGQDDLETLDEDTIYFIVSALNQLDIDYLRNKILLKVLPLKVEKL